MTQPFEHHPGCAERLAQQQAERDAWLATWPNACKACEGAGQYFYSYDPSPKGISLCPGRMYDSDPCAQCSEKGICPRCGCAWPKDDEPMRQPCPTCGWNYDEPDYAPEQPECYCYEAQQEKDLEAFEQMYLQNLDSRTRRWMRQIE